MCVRALADGDEQLLRLERPEASLTNRLLLRRSMRQRLSGVIPSPSWRLAHPSPLPLTAHLVEGQVEQVGSAYLGG